MHRVVSDCVRVSAVVVKPHDGLLARHGIQHGAWNLIHTPCRQGPGTMFNDASISTTSSITRSLGGPRCGLPRILVINETCAAVLWPWIHFFGLRRYQL